MVEANVKLVHFLANKYRYSGCDYEDLVQNGIIGLHYAVSNFKQSLGFKFSTYASIWIRKKILEEVGRRVNEFNIKSFLSDHFGRKDRLPNAYDVPNENGEGQWKREVDLNLAIMKIKDHYIHSHKTSWNLSVRNIIKRIAADPVSHCKEINKLRSVLNG